MHPAGLAADPPLALLEVGGVGLVGADLLGRHDEVEVDAEVAPRGAEQLVVDVREDPDLVLLGEALELCVRLPERRPVWDARGEETGTRRLEVPAELLRHAHGRPAQDLGVELVGAALDLALDVGEQRGQLGAVHREAVALGLLLEGLVGAQLPVDQGAVAVECDEADFLR